MLLRPVGDGMTQYKMRQLHHDLMELSHLVLRHLDGELLRNHSGIAVAIATIFLARAGGRGRSPREGKCRRRRAPFSKARHRHGSICSLGCDSACAGTNRQQTVGENEKKTSTTQTSPTLGGIHPREVEPCVSWSDPRGEA